MDAIYAVQKDGVWCRVQVERWFCLLKRILIVHIRLLGLTEYVSYRLNPIGIDLFSSCLAGCGRAGPPQMHSSVWLTMDGAAPFL